VTPTKVRVLEAAVELLGTEGLRSLTHARVDERAGLPKGSTSNYFRTRAALLTGVGDWIVETELSQVGAAAAVPQSANDLVDMLCGLVEVVTGPNRTLTAARLTVFMEANHDPEIRASVSRGRSAMEEYLLATLTRLGAADPLVGAQTLMACAEGVILHRIARHDETDPRPLIELVVAAALP
jgi:AcrR family transcriptional regulator